MKPSRARTPARPAPTRTPLASMRTPISVRTARTPAPRRQISRDEAEKDPVEVYCRLRPGEEDNNCVKIVSDTTVQLAPPSSSKSYVSGKELQCGFKCESLIMYHSYLKLYILDVFDEEATQGNVFDKVGLSLVNDLLQGKNGLLFTYGVTGSGKTHTMQGTNRDGGIMSRLVTHHTIFKENFKKCNLNNIEGLLTSFSTLLVIYRRESSKSSQTNSTDLKSFPTWTQLWRGNRSLSITSGPRQDAGMETETTAATRTCPTGFRMITSFQLTRTCSSLYLLAM